MSSLRTQSERSSKAYAIQSVICTCKILLLQRTPATAVGLMVELVILRFQIANVAMCSADNLFIARELRGCLLESKLYCN